MSRRVKGLMSHFDFMSVDTKLVGSKIRDTLTNQPQQENWIQFPSQLQGPREAPSSPNKDLFFVD